MTPNPHQHPPDGPYEIKDEDDFFYWVFKGYSGGIPIGLVVGDGPDPWKDSYQMHWRAPSGWRGMADGLYTIRAVAPYVPETP